MSNHHIIKELHREASIRFLNDGGFTGDSELDYNALIACAAEACMPYPRENVPVLSVFEAALRYLGQVYPSDVARVASYALTRMPPPTPDGWRGLLEGVIQDFSYGG